jgi:hypothetical protein
MRELLRRIAIHGALTSAVLGIIGFMLAELASLWLAGSPGIRTTNGEPVVSTDADGAVSATLRARLPLFLAVWGFAFVAVGEMFVHWWRSRRVVVTQPAKPDEAERLLEEILKQVESQKQQETGSSIPNEAPGQREQQPVVAHSEAKM